MDQVASDAALLFNALITEMSEELQTISNGKSRDDLSPSERRMYVRSIFALIEALIFSMKQMALSFHPDHKCETISEAERAFAQEQTYRLTDSGDVEVHRNKISLETNIKFSFKLFGKAGYVTSNLDTSGSEWQAFKTSIKVRDRVTHPKSVSDLSISNEELGHVFKSFGWLNISFAGLFTQILNGIAHRASQSQTEQQHSGNVV